MNEIIVKACPHCGGDSCLRYTYSRGIYYKYFVFVKCDVCGSQGKVFPSKENPEEADWQNDACISAVKAWNMRTET